MPAVNGAFSNTFVKQRAVQSTLQSADESVPREPPVIVAKPQGATVTYGMSKPLSPVVGGRGHAMLVKSHSSHQEL